MQRRAPHSLLSLCLMTIVLLALTGCTYLTKPTTTGTSTAGTATSGTSTAGTSAPAASAEAGEHASGTADHGRVANTAQAAAEAEAARAAAEAARAEAVAHAEAARAAAAHAQAMAESRSLSEASGRLVDADDLPKLVIQITVDQLRGDLLMRYRDRLNGGLAFLMDYGTWYTAAYHPHAHTETIVGHTTLVTGAYPSRHGMVGNSWYDRATGEVIKNIEDSTTTILGTTEKGVSPRTILASSIADELTIATAGRAKVFAVAQKDRAAVAMAGHTGKPFWFQTQGAAKGKFVTSSFYYNSYPAWADTWNASGIPDSYQDQSWVLLDDLSTYIFRDFDNVYPANSLPEMAMQFQQSYGVGRNFPHGYSNLGANPYFYDNLTLGPASDQLTASFAEAIITGEGLGSDDIPDYLGIGFSATDIIGHWFSPSSLESEDNILQLDKTLGEFLEVVHSIVGLENTLIVLAGDHGMPEFPEYLETIHVNTGRISQGLLQQTVAQALTERYESYADLDSVNACLADCTCDGGADECSTLQSCVSDCMTPCTDCHEFLLQYQQPYFYLDHNAIKERGLSLAEVQQFIIGVLHGIDGVALAVSASELRAGGEALDTEMIAKIRRNQHPERSGDIYVVQEPQWQMDETTASGEAPGGAPLLLHHGSPWTYDTFVPVIFAGNQVPAAKVGRKVSTTDVAPTLSDYLGVKTPSGSVGHPLVEVLAGAGGTN